MASSPSTVTPMSPTLIEAVAATSVTATVRSELDNLDSQTN